jgi:hypothetical protein
MALTGKATIIVDINTGVGPVMHFETLMDFFATNNKNSFK